MKKHTIKKELSDLNEAEILSIKRLKAKGLSLKNISDRHDSTIQLIKQVLGK